MVAVSLYGGAGERGPAVSFDDHSVVFGDHRAAYGREPLGDRIDSVSFLEFELGGVLYIGRSLCASGHDGENRDLIDQRGDDGSADRDAVKRRVADEQVGSGFCRIPADSQYADIGAHGLGDLDHARPGRVDPDAADQDLGAGDQGGGGNEIGRGGDVTGDVNPAGFKLRACLRARVPSVFLFEGVDFRSEGAQHPLGVISREGRLNDFRDAFRVEAGAENGRFHLRGSYGTVVGDPVKVSALDPERRAVISVYALNVSAHLGEGLHDPAHGSCRYGRVAADHGSERLGSQDSGDDPGGRPAVSGIKADRVRSRAQPSQTPAADCNLSFLLIDGDLHAQPAETVYRREAVRAGEESGDLRSSFCDGAQHDGPVGDGFVPGHSDLAAQRGGSA